MLKSLKRPFSTYANILTRPEGSTLIIQLNRPKALNALNADLMKEVNDALKTHDDDPQVRSFIITGNEKAFAAGADIKEMVNKTYTEVVSSRFLESWNFVTQIQKPVIAAVNGYALGGGFELAMMCDIIVASRNAKFGLPELTLATIPGAGGTQRLIREVGKAKAMEMILTGTFISAEEALSLGLIARMSESDALDEALKIANKINEFSTIATVAAKKCVNKAYEHSLAEGLDYEKQVFWGTFATEDRKEGMTAFSEKRKPKFNDK